MTMTFQEKIGTCATIEHIVCAKDLATAWKNDVPVLATPTLLWLAELAAMKAIEGTVPDGAMTVGVSHTMKHLAPTPIGFKVMIEAKVTGITRQLVTFDITAHDGNELVLVGTHERAVIDRDRFLARVEKKAITNRQSN